MKPDEVKAIYDHDYARAYDDRFLLVDYASGHTQREVEVLKEILGGGGSWLDVGCGTGWYLSQFPEVRRAGLDLSPDMLKLARERNPDVEFREGDFRDRVDEWRGAWSVVSCMWAAYAYVDTIAEVGTAVGNMIDWTADGGSLFIPMVDLRTLRGADVAYRESTTFFSGETWLNGCIWSWTDEDGRTRHENLIAPHPDQFTEWLKPHFEAVTVIGYPAGDGLVQHEALLATGKRHAPDFSAAAPVARIDGPAPAQVSRLSSFTVEELLSEVVSRAKPGRVLRGLAHRVRRLSGSQSH